MISEVDVQDFTNPWLPVYCDQCQHCLKVLTVLAHRYVLTYCSLNGNTLTNDDKVRISRPVDCPLEGGDGD